MFDFGAKSTGEEFDPVTLEIFWSRLISIADESAAALLRTSFSTIVRESNDFGTVLMDANGDSLSENTGGIPSFAGILPITLKHFLAKFPRETWKPHDCVITNDPWLATGHLPDITMVMPVFCGGQLVGFSGSIAHSPDIGGSLWSADCRELFEEGLCIPPIKFLEEGKPNKSVEEMIVSNVRLPEQVLGDLNAQVTANQVCGRRLKEFLEDSELRDLSLLSKSLLGRAETAMRKAIEEVPDGIYCSTLDADGFDEDETHIECAVTVKGSNIIIDYEGTSKQIDRGLNTVMNYTHAYSAYPIKCALDPFTPRNEGSYRPIEVVAPKGSILNPIRPAPCNARQLTGHMLAGVIYSALAQAVPTKVIADSGSAPSMRAIFSGLNLNGNRFTQILFASGGMGARPTKDGISTIAFPTNAGAGSIEAFESVAPLIVWQKEFRVDSGGAGTFRGGLGQVCEIESRALEPLQLSLLSDRWRHPATGILGGLEGAKSHISFSDGTVPHQKSRTTIAPGIKLKMVYAGGGGYGDPAQRESRRVCEDLKNGYITADAASRIYGEGQ